jgi:outer membrane protein assembly factor BamB
VNASGPFRPWRVRTGGAIGRPPIVADGMVFAPSTDGHVYAVEAVDGSVRWRLRWSDEPLEFYGAARGPVWLAHSSGTVYVGSRTLSHPAEGPGAVHAVDAVTGQPRWKLDSPDSSVFGVAAGADELVVSYWDHLRCHDRGSGVERWRYLQPDVPKVDWGRPLIHRGLVLSALSVPSQTLDFDDEYTVVVAVDLRTGQERWRHATSATDVELAAADDRLYVAAKNGELTAIDLDTGEAVPSGDHRWGIRFPARPTEQVAKLTWHPSRSLVPTVAVLTHTRVSAALGTPLVTADCVFLPCGNGNAYRVARPDARQLNAWTFSVQVTAVAHGDGRLYLGLADGTLHGCSDSADTVLWSTSTPTGRIAGLTYADGVLYASGDPHLIAVDGATGAGPWRWPRQRTRRRSVTS